MAPVRVKQHVKWRPAQGLIVRLAVPVVIAGLTFALSMDFATKRKILIDRDAFGPGSPRLRSIPSALQSHGIEQAAKWLCPAGGAWRGGG